MKIFALLLVLVDASEVSLDSVSSSNSTASDAPLIRRHKLKKYICACR